MFLAIIMLHKVAKTGSKRTCITKVEFLKNGLLLSMPKIQQEDLIDTTTNIMMLLLHYNLTVEDKMF